MIEQNNCGDLSTLTPGLDLFLKLVGQRSLASNFHRPTCHGGDIDHNPKFDWIGAPDIISVTQDDHTALGIGQCLFECRFDLGLIHTAQVDACSMDTRKCPADVEEADGEQESKTADEQRHAGHECHLRGTRDPDALLRLGFRQRS